MRREGIWLSLGLGFAALLADRLYKFVQVDAMHWPVNRFGEVLPILDVGLVFNPGVSYGLLASLPGWGLGLIIIVALGALVVWWFRTPSLLVRAGLALCIGGALSNAVDRLIYNGAVADSFWLHFGDFSFFIFNVADAAITLGVGLLLLDFLGLGRSRAANPA